MTDLAWHKPVTIATGRGFALPVNGPREAVEVLDAWTSERGKFYDAARDACLEAVRRPDRALHARQAFVAAFLDAAIPFV